MHGVGYQARAAGVYGAGIDANITSHLFVRAQYRGLIYNSPTYDLAALAGMDRVTQRFEPSVGFGWRFWQKSFDGVIVGRTSACQQWYAD